MRFCRLRTVAQLRVGVVRSEQQVEGAANLKVAFYPKEYVFFFEISRLALFNLKSLANNNRIVQAI